MNSKLQTSNPDIYAIGDVAAFPINNYGLNKLMRQEHVANCRQSAKHAVAAIMDPKTPDYDYLPFFYSRIFDLGWQVLLMVPAEAAAAALLSLLVYPWIFDLGWQVWLHDVICSCRELSTGASMGAP